MKWKPKVGESFWMIIVEPNDAPDRSKDIRVTSEVRDSAMNANFNCFKTKQEANKVRRLIIEALSGKTPKSNLNPNPRV